MNYEVKNNSLNSHTNDLTQKTRDLGQVQAKIEETNNDITFSELSLKNQESRKESVEAKVKENSQKFQDLTNGINEITQKIASLKISPGIVSEKAQKIGSTENLIYELKNIEEQMSKLTKTEDMGEKIKKLIEEYAQKLKQNRWFITSRKENHKKSNKRKDRKKQLETYKWRSITNLNKAQSNLKTTIALIGELTKMLENYKENLKNFKKEEGNLTTQIKNISSQISLISS